jgi:hypothetical protein
MCIQYHHYGRFVEVICLGVGAKLEYMWEKGIQGLTVTTGRFRYSTSVTSNAATTSIVS